MRFLFLLLWGFIFPGMLQGVDGQQLFQKAIAEYDQGRYSEAAKIFEDIIAADPHHTYGGVLYNLGNAYYKSQDYGSALAAYLAARQDLPRDPDLAANIRFVQEKATSDAVKANRSLTTLQRLLGASWPVSSKERLLLVALGFSLMIIGLIMAMFVSPNQVAWVGVSVAAGLLSGYLTAGYISACSLPPLGAVKVAEAEVYSGRDSGAAVVFALRNAAPVAVLEQTAGWSKIQLSDAKMGWIPTESIALFSGKLQE